MPAPLILASSSQSRADMLRSVGLAFDTQPAMVDEDAVIRSLVAEGARGHDIADALAEMKAAKIARKGQGGLVLGSDQVLWFDNGPFQKASDPVALIDQLKSLRGARHQVFSAAVFYEDGKPVWRHVGQARLFMHDFSDAFIENYVTTYFETVKYCVGGYRIEAEGAQLFDRIEGDWHAILGMPLLPLLSYLRLRGIVPT